MSSMPVDRTAPTPPALRAEGVRTTPPHQTSLRSTGLVGLTGEEARAKLKALANELEAVFLNQLFQAMRASVPREGLGDASSAEEMFTAMLDEQFAREATQHIERGIGDALYRQLAKRLPPEGAPDSP